MVVMAAAASSSKHIKRINVKRKEALPKLDELERKCGESIFMISAKVGRLILPWPDVMRAGRRQPVCCNLFDVFHKYFK